MLTAHRDAVNQVYSSERRLEEDGGWRHINLFFKSNKDATGTLFTPAQLQTICKLQELIYTEAQKLEELREISFDSPIGIFYDASDRSMSKFFEQGEKCDSLEEAQVAKITQQIWDDIKAVGPTSQYARFVHPSFKDSGLTPYTMSTASLKGPPAKEDGSPDYFQPVMDEFFKEVGTSYGFLQSAYEGEEDRFLPYKDLRVRFFATFMDEFKLVEVDFTLAIGSFFIVLLLIYIYTESFFIASSAMYQILFSLPVTMVFYRWVFQVDYFEFLHILIVYLVLGIGADNVFVFIDSFKNIWEEESRTTPEWSEEKLQRVVRGAHERSASAILNTSFTTSVAFLSCSISKVMPMRTAGWFAAGCIIVNYIFTVTWFPSVVTIWFYRFRGKRCFCPDCGRASPYSEEVPDESKSKRISPSALFFDRFYIPVMNKQIGCVRPVPLFILCVLLATAAQGAYFASQLTPPQEAEQWFPDNHMVLELGAFMGENYYSPDTSRYAVLTFFWGIEDFDLSDFDVYHPDDGGGVVKFDANFDLSTAEAQTAMLNTCQKLRTLECKTDGCDNRGYSKRTLLMQTEEKSISCFLEEFKSWNGGSLPVGNAFLTLLKQFREESPPFNGSEVLSAEYSTDIGIINDKLKYAAVRMRSTLPESQPFGKGMSVRKVVADFAEEIRGEMPEGMKSFQYHADGTFASYELGEELLSGFFSGCAIAGPIAFLVLLLSTKNIITALYAVFCVGSIVACVLGFCKSAMGWSLGIGEAIAGVIVIGYSVDYVVHLAHMYCEAGHHGYITRDSRCIFAISNMGSTVFAGAITTAASAVIMFACFLYFFVKMAILICVTIMYSYLFSLGLFMALMWTAGPQGNVGDLTKICSPEGCTKIHPHDVQEPEKNAPADSAGMQSTGVIAKDGTGSPSLGA
jgi:hypothetical protein